MKIATLRARVTLWSVGVVTIALALFAAGAAWSLRQELIENLDKDIQAEAHDFFIALKQQRVDWRDRRSVEALFDQSKRLRYLEIRNDAGHVLYRSQELEKGPAFLMCHGSPSKILPGMGVLFVLACFIRTGLSWVLAVKQRKSPRLLHSYS